MKTFDVISDRLLREPGNEVDTIIRSGFRSLLASYQDTDSTQNRDRYVQAALAFALLAIADLLNEYHNP